MQAVVNYGSSSDSSSSSSSSRGEGRCARLKTIKSSEERSCATLDTDLQCRCRADARSRTDIASETSVMKTHLR